MTTKTLRLPEDLTEAVHAVGSAEHIEESTAMRKLLRMGYELYTAERYRTLLRQGFAGQAAVSRPAEGQTTLEMTPGKRHHHSARKLKWDDVKENDISVESMADAIVRAVQPEKVMLFGSRCRPDARAGSDVDLLVIEREPFGNGRSRRAETRRIRRSPSLFRRPVDILVFSEDEIEKWRGSINHVVGHALREGKTLYARS